MAKANLLACTIFGATRDIFLFLSIYGFVMSIVTLSMVLFNIANRDSKEWHRVVSFN